MTRRTRGFSVIEMLVAIAIIGILAGIGFSSLRPPSARLLANDYKALVQQARHDAIKHMRPTAVVWDAAAQEFAVRRSQSMNAVSCAVADTDLIRVKRVNEYRDVQVSSLTGTGSGIVWLPTGMARDCANGVNASGTVTFTSGSTSITVQIATQGNVRIQ